MSRFPSSALSAGHAALATRSPTAGAPASSPPSEGAFEALLLEHFRFLWRALRTLGVPDRDLEDLCQEVALVAYRHWQNFDGRSPRSWLYAIALRVASDYRRSARVRREKVSDAPPEASVPERQHDDAIRSQNFRVLQRSLDELDDLRRDIFVLYEIEQLSLQEIAEIVETPLATVYRKLASAREAVKLAFARHGGQEP